MSITNKQYVKVFKRAKQFLAKDYSEVVYKNKVSFICWAIIDAKTDQLITSEESYYARALIESRLGIHGNVYGWLHSHVGISGSKLTPDALQTYRHEWLDHLIKEFSE